jgi:hypothetical protein
VLTHLVEIVIGDVPLVPSHRFNELIDRRHLTMVLHAVP